MFITLEGMEGSGKSTLSNALAAHFRSTSTEAVCHAETVCRTKAVCHAETVCHAEAASQTVLQTREPGGCTLGQTLRGLLLHTDSVICPEAELFLFLADRAQHVAEVIRPALAAGTMVLCDRFADSTIVYQGYGRGFDIERLWQLNDMAVGGLWPTLTLVLDVPPETGLLRARRRNSAADTAIAEGRFEAEALAFHQRVREGFSAWAARNPQRCVVLNGLLSPEELFAAALQAIAPYRGA